MSGKTELSLLEKQGWIEPMLRVFLEEHPRLKKAQKKRVHFIKAPRKLIFLLQSRYKMYIMKISGQGAADR